MTEPNRQTPDGQPFAIAAFACALVGLLCLPSMPIALVLGHVARARNKRSGERRGSGLAAAALVISYGWLGLVAVAAMVALATMPMAFRRMQQDLADAEATLEAPALDEDSAPEPAPVERGPLPARLSAELPLNFAAIARDPERYRPLAYARAQLCRGEGDARERFVTAFVGAQGVKDDGLRYEYSAWPASCESADACRWIRGHAKAVKAAARKQLQPLLDECAERRTNGEPTAEPDFVWAYQDDDDESRVDADELAHCATDAQEKDWKRNSCLWRLARRDRARASALAARRLAEDAATRADPKAAPDPAVAVASAPLRALAEHPSLDTLEAKLRQIGLLPAGARPTTKSAPATVEELLEVHGRLWSFDAETGTFPNRHDLLAGNLASMTDLVHVYFEEIPPPDFDDDGDYQIRALTDGFEYRVVARNHGDWYDVDAVLRLVNRMLSDAGSELRLDTLVTWDQTVTAIAAAPTAVVEAARLGLLAHESASAAEARGKAFEQQVRERLLSDTPAP